MNLNKLHKVVRDIEPSKSKYKISIRKDFISLNHIVTPDKKRHEEWDTNVLVRSAVNNVREDFAPNTGKFLINEYETYMSTLEKIHDTLLEDMVRVMPQKHPKETKLYKFFRDQKPKNMTQKMQGIIVELFCFIHDGTDEDKNRRDQILKLLKYIHTTNS